MSKYVNAIRKIANDGIMALAGSNIKEMVSKCVAAGYKSFSWNGDVYLIIDPDDSLDKSERSIIKTPFTLEDFEV